jgi:Na+/H+-dicarboxylate symporter
MRVIQVNTSSFYSDEIYQIFFLAVMMAAVIDITNDDQRQIVRRLFRESGNVNVKTTDVYLNLFLLII